MKGILIKELYYLKTYKKVLAVLVLLYMVFGLMMDGGVTVMSLLIVMGPVVSLTLFSYDESCKWDNYALSLPVRRKEIVGVRYLVMLGVMLMFTAMAVLFTFLLQLLRPQQVAPESWSMIRAACAAAVLLFSILVPIAYRFGAEKARMAMLIGVFIPTGAVLLFKQLGTAMPSRETVEVLISRVLPLVAAGSLILSYLIACIIYEHKEF